MNAPDWLPYLYQASLREKRNSHPVRAIVRDQLPVSIRRVDAHQAPIAFEMNRRGSSILWRIVDGALMREAIDFGGQSGGPEVLKAAHTHFMSGGAADHQQVRALIYRLRAEALFLDQVYDHDQLVPGAQAYSGRAIVDVDRRQRPEAQSQAQVFASTLAVVDGKLMIPAAEPVLHVGVSPLAGPLQVEIVPGITGRDYGSGAHAAFRIDQVEEAHAFAEALAAQAQDLFREATGQDRGPAVVTGGDALCETLSLDFDRGVGQAPLSPLSAFMTVMGWKMRDVAMKSLPPLVLAGYGMMLGSLVPGQEDLERAVLGYRMFRDNIDDRTWPRPEAAWDIGIEASLAANAPAPRPDQDADLAYLTPGGRL
ncbi:hypothetical protein BSY19_5305 (plasmid) [Bosea sp. RAC05]|nr:hypothetical protein BSY19_5305 [Bosea sp. RAC05]